MERHVEAFKALGGCAATCLYDNMKTVVLRWEADVPIYNPRFLLFATHYGFRPKACRPRRPRTKGKVERPFGYVKGNFLCGRRFHDIEDLNAQARVWLAQTADVRIHRTTRRRPIDLWEEERDALLPLPSRPYDTSQIAYKVASPEGLVAWEGNAYSVPQDFIGEIVIARASEKELRLYSASFDEIGCHELAPRGQGLKIRLPAHRIRLAENAPVHLDILRERFLHLAECAREYLVGLALVHPRNLRHHLCRLLELRDVYSTADLGRAIRHALSYKAFDARTVERILSRTAKPRCLEAAIAHCGPCGGPRADEGRQRDPAFYQHLFCRCTEDQ